MNNSINDWRYYQKKGLEKLKARIKKEELILRSNYQRNFEFSFESLDKLKEIILNQFGKENIIIYPQTTENEQNEIFIEDYEIKSNGIYIAINADIDRKPYWGYIGLNNINDQNKEIAFQLANTIDSIVINYPLELEYKKVLSPLIRPD
jgi:hypothetical protein